MSALTHLFEIRIDDPSLFLSEIGDSSTGCSPGLFWTDTVLEKIRIFRRRILFQSFVGGQYQLSSVNQRRFFSLGEQNNLEVHEIKVHLHIHL